MPKKPRVPTFSSFKELKPYHVEILERTLSRYFPVPEFEGIDQAKFYCPHAWSANTHGVFNSATLCQHCKYRTLQAIVEDRMCFSLGGVRWFTPIRGE